MQKGCVVVLYLCNVRETLVPTNEGFLSVIQ